MCRRSFRMKRYRGGNDGAVREEELIKNVADRIEASVGGVNSAMSTHEAGSHSGECEE